MKTTSPSIITSLLHLPFFSPSLSPKITTFIDNTYMISLQEGKRNVIQETTSNYYTREVHTILRSIPILNVMDQYSCRMIDSFEQINETRKLIGPAAAKFPCQCSDTSLLRYLRARNYNTKRAAKMMKETLKWRLKNKPESIQWDDIAHEAKTGKLYRASYVDKFGRAVLIIRPGMQNPNPIEDQIKCLVYCMETAISDLRQGQEQMVWLIDFRRWNMGSISMKLVRQTACVLQDHYPERLGIAILYNPPKLFESFWLLVKPFLEPKTYKKVRFVYSDQPQSTKIMEALFDMEKLERCFGGKNMESYDFEAYAKRMKDEEKRNKNSSPSDQISVTFESDFLVSEVSSVVSDEADSSSNYGVGSDLEVVDEMEARLGLDCRNKAEKKLVRDNKMEDATVVIS